ARRPVVRHQCARSRRYHDGRRRPGRRGVHRLRRAGEAGDADRSDRGAERVRRGGTLLPSPFSLRPSPFTINAPPSKEALMRRRIALGLVVALAAAAVPLIGQSPPARASVDPRVAAALELVRVWLEGERAYDQIPGVSAAVV